MECELVRHDEIRLVALCPPLRYMAALDAVAGDTKSAMRSVEKLRKLEPDFSLKKMVEDEEYPVAGLRRAGILSKDKLTDMT